MADLQSLVDHIHYENRREYTHVEGDVAYLDGSPLRRPFEMPKSQRVIAIIIIAIAVAIGAIFVNNTVLAGLRETMQAEQNVTANLARQASIDTLPQMSQLITLSDDDIRATFANAGYTVFDASDPNDATSMVLYKLPDDVSVEEAAALYAKGVGTLSATQASKLLNGSWYFSSDRNGGTTMVARYSDFLTGDPARAVQNALAKQGIAADAVSESGVDDSGNTYSMGPIDCNGTACVFKVSALPLSDVYSISGLPEDACYVGVRITVQ